MANCHNISKVKEHGKKAKPEDEKSLKSWLLDHQIELKVLSSSLIVFVVMLHTSIPSTRPYTTKFLTLSSHNLSTNKHAADHVDIYFIAFHIIVLTFLRATLMKHILNPFAKYRGISSSKSRTRFAEQGWIFSYYIIMCPIGFYIYYQSPQFLDMQNLWTNWPQRELDGLTKRYILVQLSYCIQEVFVLNVEKRRKDYWQMLTHHFVTIALIISSYAYHHTRVGTLILALMDVIDVVFPLAKCLKYLGHTTLCDIMFGIFVLSWLLTRHVFFLMICWSIWSDVPRVITPGCYRGTVNDLQGPYPVPETGWAHLLSPFVDPSGIVSMNDNISLGFLACLVFLQGIMILWFLFIIRVVLKVIRGGSAEDIRSDTEEALEGEEHVRLEELPPLRVEVDAEGLKYRNRENSRLKAKSSGKSLPAYSRRRKELLDRIGCEKQID